MKSPKMVVPLLLLGYSLLTANFTAGLDASIPSGEAGDLANETMKLPGERDKRNLPMEGEFTPPSSSEGGAGISMESSTHQQNRAKRDEDDDTPLHEDYENEKSDVGLAALNGTSAENSTASEGGHSGEMRNELSAEMHHQNSSAEGNIGEEEHAPHPHHGHHHPHGPIGHLAPSEHEDPTTTPSEGKRRRKRQAIQPSNNPEKEPFGDENPAAGEDHSGAANGEESIEKKNASGTSGHEGESTPELRPARAIGLGHRARSQSVQKSQQQAGRGPKSDGTD